MDPSLLLRVFVSLCFNNILFIRFQGGQEKHAVAWNG